MVAAPVKRHVSALIDLGPALLLGIAPFIILPTGGEFENYPKMLFLQWGAALLGLLRLSLVERLERRIQLLDVAVVLLYSTCWLSLVWATNPYRAVVPLSHISAGLILYFLVTAAPRPKRTVQALFVACAVGTGIVSLIGLCQYFLGLDAIPQARPPASTFSNRNMAAHYVAMALPFSVGALIFCRTHLARALTIAGIVAGFGFLGVARSNAAWLAVAVAAALAAGATPFVLRHRRVTVVLSVLVVLVLAALPLSSELLVLDDATGAENAPRFAIGSWTAQLRWIYWSNSLALVADTFPRGVGLANFEIRYPLYHRAVEVDWTFGEEYQLRRVHNDHLQLLAELGAIGFAAWIAVQLAFVVACWQVFRRGERSAAWQALMIGLGGVSVLVVGTFSFPMERAIPPAFLFVCLGGAAALRRTLTPLQAHAERQMRILPRLVAATLLLIFLVLSALVMNNAIRTEALEYRARQALSGGRIDDAIGDLSVAQVLSPGEPRIPLLLAQGYATQGRFELAIVALERALQLHPNSVSALLNLGYVHIQLEQYDAARRYLERGLEILPNSLSGHSNLGLIHFRRGEYAAAIERYRRIVDRVAGREHYGDPDQATQQLLLAHLQLGGAHAALGETAEAIAEYESALKIRPGVPEVQAALVKLQKRVREVSPAD